MARVTVEDCLENVENRFELVLLASKRAHQLATTAAEPGVPWDNDKPTVVALREIAAGKTDLYEKELARLKNIETQIVQKPIEKNIIDDLHDSLDG